MNNTSVLSVAKNRVVWLDVVRFVAMFTVVCCHCADPFNFYSGEPSAELEQIKFWGAAYGAFLRPCVPLFVMITGALLLPVRGETSRKGSAVYFGRFFFGQCFIICFPG